MIVDKKTMADLKNWARKALGYSYSPYSNFPVGAAVIGDNGKIYKGTNIEIVSFTGSTCAERAAIVSAISDGAKHIVAVAIYSPTDKIISPCGTCRQIISEFAKKDCAIICFNDQSFKEFFLGDLIPNAFDSIEKLTR